LISSIVVHDTGKTISLIQAIVSSGILIVLGSSMVKSESDLESDVLNLVSIYIFFTYNMYILL
jgi:hypothetical protein